MMAFHPRRRFEESTRRCVEMSAGLVAVAAEGWLLVQSFPDGSVPAAVGALLLVVALAVGMPWLTHTVDRAVLWWRTRGYGGGR